MVSTRHTHWVTLCIFFQLTSLGAAQKGQRLELRGQILAQPLKKLAEANASVLLTGATTPYSAQTWSDGKGRFKFRNLLPATYDLTVTLPNRDEARQTIEVTPSFAGGRGVVSTTITVTHAGPPGGASTQDTVSARELSISEAAHKEYRRAQEQLEKRNPQEAIRHLEKAVKLAPQFVEAWNQLGTIRYQTQDYAQAEKYFRQALTLDPQAFPPLVNLGGTLFSLKRYEESLRVNQQAVAAQPNDTLANAQLGLCYLVLGNDEEARKYLAKAKALDPGHFTHPQIYLAEIDEREGSKQEAVRELEDFLTRHPDSPLAGKVRAKIQRLQSQK
jgi:tetratricopeptide (TPR) repeat protein